MSDFDVSDIKPLVVRDPQGSVTDVTQTNEKGYKKSIEQHALWVVHVETGRLLPHDVESRLEKIEDRGGWYEAVVEPAQAGGASIARAAGASASKDRSVGHGAEDVLPALYEVIASRRRERPEGSYTTYLFQEGIDKIKKKTGEEAIELLLAESNGERIHEAADLFYHVLVLLAETGITFEELLTELRSR